jgi:hypothetical protein
VLTRRVALGADRDATLQAAVFLVGNLARDEASEVLGELERTEAEEAPPPPAPVAVAERSPPVPPRLWFGLSLEGTLMFLPGTGDACPGDGGNSTLAVAPSVPSPSSYSCLQGSTDAAAAYGPRSVASGLAFANTRVLATADYAIDEHVLLGARVGYSTGTYPGHSHAAFGPLHAEGRVTFLPAAHALSQLVTPAFVVGAGATELSASVKVVGGYPGYPGYVTLVPPTADAWRVTGPFFASAGAGLRLTPWSRFALVAYPLKAMFAFGSAGTGFALTPELTAQVGF